MLISDPFAEPAMHIRDRVKELRRVRARDLVANPLNWRMHPKAQQDALRGILSEVGFADALLARELPDGRLILIDGHLRAETTPDQEVPVLILDVSESEANQILATLDPLGMMAEANAGALDDLLRDVQTSNDALQVMLDDLVREARAGRERDDARYLGLRLEPGDIAQGVRDPPQRL